VIRLSFLSLALVLVPGAFLCVCAYLILKGRSRRKADRVAEEQARYLPRNPARDWAKCRLDEVQECDTCAFCGSDETMSDDGFAVCAQCRRPRGRSLCGANFAGGGCERWPGHVGMHQAKCDDPCCGPAGVLSWSDEDEKRLMDELAADLRGEDPALKHIVRNGRVEWHKPLSPLHEVGNGTETEYELMLAGTDEPSAPEEGRYHFAPGGAYVFDWSDPAHHYAWETGKALVYTASNGTTSTTLTVNNPGDQCAVSDQCAPISDWPSSHPMGHQLVFLGAGNMLCAVASDGSVSRYSRPQVGWVSVSETLARMAREALGRAA
jgi:hypothetical protein